MPAVSVRDRRAIGPVRGETDTEPSLDVFYKITPQLNASLTINTDFSATEVDDRQVNLTRFSLFFPRRRDFFLQDVDIFHVRPLAAGRPAVLLAPARHQPSRPGKCRSTSAARSAAASAASTSARSPSARRRIETRRTPECRRDDGIRRPRRRQRARGIERRHDRDERQPDLEPRQQRGRRRLPLCQQPLGRRPQRSSGDAWFQQSDSGTGCGGDDTALGFARAHAEQHGIARRRRLQAHRGRTSIRRSASCGARASTTLTLEFGHTWRPRGSAIRTIFSGLDADAHRVSRRRFATAKARRAEPERQPASAEHRAQLAGRVQPRLLATAKKGCETPFTISRGVMIPEGSTRSTR